MNEFFNARRKASSLYCPQAFKSSASVFSKNLDFMPVAP